MKVIYTDEALRDLDGILTFIRSRYPSILPAFEQRLRSIERRVGRWPMSAEEVSQRPGVRVVPFIRYPYKIFYRVTGETVEILHVHHAGRLG
jgi:toxin ParE1/3/4